MFAHNRFPLKIKKVVGCEVPFGWEITVALLVKFLLLGGLWWLFFAGHKQPVDEAMIAGKIFGEPHSFTISGKNQRSVQ